jgi:glutamate dehydrogenase
LYTIAAYHENPRQVPLVRRKVERVLARAAFPPDSHDAKALARIVDTYPRDSLFQITTDELFDAAMGILGLGERQRLKLFVRRDPYDRFLACLVFIPRDRFNTENRERISAILAEAFGATRVDWSPYISESVLVRLTYVLWCDPEAPVQPDLAALEARLKRVIRSWSDDLRDVLVEEQGEERGTQLFRRYQDAFPPAYRADWSAPAAVEDILRLEALAAGEDLLMSIYRPLESMDGAVRCKLFSASPITLSDVLPTFEHMGARVTDERPYQVTTDDAAPSWIYDFGLTRGARGELGDEHAREIFQAAFLGVYRGELEDDGLGALVLEAWTSTCARPASCSPTGTSSARCSPTPRSRSCWWNCSRPDSIPTTTTRPPPSCWRVRSSRRSMPSRASTRTGSCGAFTRLYARW